MRHWLLCTDSATNSLTWQLFRLFINAQSSSFYSVAPPDCPFWWAQAAPKASANNNTKSKASVPSGFHAGSVKEKASLPKELWLLDRVQLVSTKKRNFREKSTCIDGSLLPGGSAALADRSLSMLTWPTPKCCCRRCILQLGWLAKCMQHSSRSSRRTSRHLARSLAREQTVRQA